MSPRRRMPRSAGKRALLAGAAIAFLCTAQGHAQASKAQPVADGLQKDEMYMEADLLIRDDKAKTTTARGHWETVELIEGEPNSGLWRQKVTSSWIRDAWDCQVTAVIELRSTETEFLLTESLSATQSGQVIFERSEDARIPRNLV